MTKNPFYNALAASAYIVFGVFFMTWFTRQVPPPDTFLIPMAVLSLFVLSAAIMGYLFVYQPIVLLIEGKHKEALNLFLSTVGIFAIFTAAIVLANILVR